MPKEITHWLIARKVAEAARGGPAGDAALEHPRILLLGSIFPDVLYFMTGPPALTRYREIARACHGARGEDTYTLIRRVAAALAHRSPPGPLWAFLVGIACHIQTDAAFHPLVYYLTGNYDDGDPVRQSQAVKGHRRLECLMDLYFCGGFEGLNGHSLAEILDGLECPLPDLLEAAFRDEDLLRAYPEVVGAAARAFRTYRMLQGVCRRRRLAGFLAAICPLLTRPAQEIAALFYRPADEIRVSRLSSPLIYRNPVTGELEETSIDGLFARAVVKSHDLVKAVETAVFSGAPILPGRGPSLSYGFIGDGPALPRYFVEKTEGDFFPDIPSTPTKGGQHADSP